MLITMLKSKIHRATITETNLSYAGSLTLDPLLIEAAGMLVNEHIQVVNISNGARFETYIIPGQRGSGAVCLNGAAARLGEPGDLVIVLAYGLMDPDEARAHVPRIVHVDARNRVLRVDSSQD
jgi:aspartate 1-decarboxylase